MKQYIKHISNKHIFLGLVSLALVSIVFSKFLLSVSMIGMLFLSFFHVDSVVPLRIEIRNDWRNNATNAYTKKPWLFFGLIFLVCLVSGFWSHDTSSWLDALRINLPFLILPFVFISQAKLSKKVYLAIHFIWILVCVLAAIFVLINYFLDFEAITESIKQGQAIPTPFSRPNFSVVIAFGFLTTLALIIDPALDLKLSQKYILILISVFLLLFLHILSVRSGLLVAYLGVISLVIIWLLKSKKFLVVLGMFALLASVPVVSYFTIPSFKNKLNYSVYDLKQFGSNKGATYSDSERIYSIQAGWHVFKKNPIVGSGIGDLRSECMRYYRAEKIQMLKFKYPHNQFIYILAAYGLSGLLLFLVSIYGPLFHDKNYKNIYLLMFYLSITGLFLVESPLGRANMLAFYLLFVSIGMMRQRN